MHEPSGIFVLRHGVPIGPSYLDTFYQCLSHDRDAQIPNHITSATMGNQSSRGGTASERTAFSDVTDSEGSSTKLPSLHGNLMRSQHKRDPMK
jgi:hypothetical protein